MSTDHGMSDKQGKRPLSQNVIIGWSLLLIAGIGLIIYLVKSNSEPENSADELRKVASIEIGCTDTDRARVVVEGEKGLITIPLFYGESLINCAENGFENEDGRAIAEKQVYASAGQALTEYYGQDAARVSPFGAPIPDERFYRRVAEQIMAIHKELEAIEAKPGETGDATATGRKKPDSNP